MKKIIAFILFFIVMNVTNSSAQCAMCKRTAETDFESQKKESAGKGLNKGILYLLSVPYLIGAVGAVVWYKNKRKDS